MRAYKLAEPVTSLWVFLSIIQIFTSPTDASPMDKQGDSVDTESYGVLLDAGSSSTKLKVYRWTSPGADTLVPQIELIKNQRFEPGLATFEDDLRGLTLYLHTILSVAKMEVPKTRRAEAPMFLMATAGLRFLSAKDASRLLRMTRTVLTNKTLNPFLYSPSSVSVLSGEEEGVYSWLAANYLLGFFDRYRPINESVGVLEMGGGSTQITFVPNGPLFSEEFQVTVAGRQIQLYVQSYLLYGANSVPLKIAHILSGKNPKQKEVENPCMLKDDTSNIKLENGKPLMQKGTGSPTKCLELLTKILKPNRGINCQPKPCAIGSIYQPSVAGISFYATQAFTYAPKTLKAVDENKILNIDRLEEAAFKHCNRTLEEALQEPGFSRKFASHDCLMGLYIPTLLTLSYGFSRNTTNIKLTSDIGDQKIDWSLGAMLVHYSSINPGENYVANPKFMVEGDDVARTVSNDDAENGAISSHSSTTNLYRFLLCSLVVYLCNLRC